MVELGIPRNRAIADQPRSSDDLVVSAFGGTRCALVFEFWPFTQLLRKETPLSPRHRKGLRNAPPESASSATTGSVHTCRQYARKESTGHKGAGVRSSVGVIAGS